MLVIEASKILLKSRDKRSLLVGAHELQNVTEVQK